MLFATVVGLVLARPAALGIESLLPVQRYVARGWDTMS
jgi:hypothetical protein